ncbi:MAG: peptide-methionine (S)-S-oxide reductase MsrA [Brevundimonas sp.]|uniref:peptide-methionine (S)-S-oxide reductase MsrA n=1 Tax=Brevundimonas sp. TaxID=1871086 RepID=UPI002727EBD6|nr:peptide-methionine (S)-S-oxide reductase MsrA [Brevundimonas sp.]MDO9587714.1 peptide-methionine (S)-S-oxide reductase MsrA [Brevundimonas sp.]MDP3370966.1 peptide-methionine (S)-S-oxide reductase MsrA [Brevundimonas sp.]MDP3655869.1 peptide-methionine (S)-S-oxide reductase MsrA [Brevundimonas sp.]MDZ4111761.1 peptide-methionine (S)-S-oxide reductase MsrA [Brevundimonas sp.]
MSRRALANLVILVLAACSPGEPAAGAPGARQAGDSGRREVAVFAGGCFWSVEANFERMPGVVAAVSGFAGGSVVNPTYDQVVRGGAGHLEAVQVTYDPARISYRQLVDGFWLTIDPTDPDGQFCDRGAPYATAVFASASQRPAAEASRRAAAARLGPARFVTPVRDAARFWPAEAHHQDFARLNPVRYGGYSRFCGRAARLRAVWGESGPIATG